jgi:hypothetical protein
MTLCIVTHNYFAFIVRIDEIFIKTFLFTVFVIFQIILIFPSKDTYEKYQTCPSDKKAINFTFSYSIQKVIFVS